MKLKNYRRCERCKLAGKLMLAAIICAAVLTIVLIASMCVTTESHSANISIVIGGVALSFMFVFLCERSEKIYDDHH